jgi:hypothetical protein
MEPKMEFYGYFNQLIVNVLCNSSNNIDNKGPLCDAGTVFAISIIKCLWMFTLGNLVLFTAN